MLDDNFLAVIIGFLHAVESNKNYFTKFMSYHQCIPEIEHRAAFLLQSLLHDHSDVEEYPQAPLAGHLGRLSVFQILESVDHAPPLVASPCPSQDFYDIRTRGAVLVNVPMHYTHVLEQAYLNLPICQTSFCLCSLEFDLWHCSEL